MEMIWEPLFGLIISIYRDSRTFIDPKLILTPVVDQSERMRHSSESARLPDSSSRGSAVVDVPN